MGSSPHTEGYLKDIEDLTAENTQLKEDLSGYQKDILGYKQDITGYKENIKVLNAEIARLKNALTNHPDPSELSQLRQV